jgi:hypothetical protein
MAPKRCCGIASWRASAFACSAAALRATCCIIALAPGAAHHYKLTIGGHGSPWTPETARRETKRLLGSIEDGADPAADKIARQEAPTIADLAERFVAEHVEAKRKASTALECGGSGFLDSEIS